MPPTAATYAVVAQRELAKKGGTLTFRVNGKEKFSTQFWERFPIPAGTFTGSGEVMAKKKRNAIYLLNVPGRKGIFIHKGTDPSWSDGCLVLADKFVQQMFKAVSPSKKNVSIVVRDVPAKKLTGAWSGTAGWSNDSESFPVTITFSGSLKKLSGKLALKDGPTISLKDLKVNSHDGSISFKADGLAFSGTISSGAKPKIVVKGPGKRVIRLSR